MDIFLYVILGLIVGMATGCKLLLKYDEQELSSWALIALSIFGGILWPLTICATIAWFVILFAI